jgi:DHA1 family tetracycline resistance protein-like MFS transporter
MSSPKPTVALFPVLLVNFIGMLGYSIVIPILVFLVRKFGGNEFIYGILGSVYPFFQLIGAPLLGKWSDQIGRKRILLISQIGTFLAWLLFILALFLPKIEVASISSELTGPFLLTLPLVFLFLARALDGLTGGNVSVANAYLSDISTDENRKANFGKMGSSTSLGFIIGPTLASLLGFTILGETLPVMAAALISLIAIFVIWRFLPESRPELVPPDLKEFKIAKLFQIEQKECYEMENCPETGFLAVLKYPKIPLLFGIYFLNFLGFSFFYAGFPMYVSGYLGWTSSQLGLFLAISSGIMVVVQGPVLSYLSDKIQDGYLVMAGSLSICLSFLFIPNGDMASIYTANVFLAVGNGLMWPSFLAILSRSGKPSIQGTIQGYANSMGSLASIFGLILGGTLFGLVGPPIFFVASVMLGLIFLLSFRLVEKRPSEAVLEPVKAEG